MVLVVWICYILLCFLVGLGCLDCSYCLLLLFDSVLFAGSV